MTFRTYINWIVLLAGISTARAQDKCDPAATLFTTQEKIKYNQEGYKSVAEDMSISKMHRFTSVQQHGNTLQDLGNNGTATKPIFYVMPKEIGATSGFHAYDIYFRSPHHVKYYDSEWPYCKMHVIPDLAGSLYADVCYSQNLTPNWSIGSNLRVIEADNEWTTKEAWGKSVISLGLDYFTHYKTANENYQFLAHLLIAKHRVRETGGIYTNTYLNSLKNTANTRETIEREIWRVKNVMNRLVTGEESPESSDVRAHFFVYHQLAITKQLWGYHEMAIREETHNFKADLEHYAQYRKFLSDDFAGTIKDKETTIVVQDTRNEVGIKGNWRDWFSCGYIRYKEIKLRPQQKENNQDLQEYYAGFRARRQLADSKHSLHLSGEYLLQGCYQTRIAYEGANFDLTFEQVRHRPSFLAQHHHGYHRNWNKQLVPPTATQISGGLRLISSNVRLRPHARFTRIANHIYFEHQFKGSEYRKQDQRYMMMAVPKQAEQHVNMAVLGTDVDLALGTHIRWDSELMTAIVQEASKEILNVPSLLINSRLYYTDITAAGNGTFETGIDVHWKSSYMADGYDPVTQQFYLQDECSVYSYPIIDLFLNFRINSFSAFLKFSHFNESWLAPASGYFVTPLYPGRKKGFDVGISWSFFD